jgi:hypothetical protein
MTLSKADIELFAARIRLHFEPELRDDANALAREIANGVGARVKDLRPETNLGEILEWFGTKDNYPISLDRVEWMMGLEVELGFELEEFDGGSMERTTFRRLVQLRNKRRLAA